MPASIASECHDHAIKVGQRSGTHLRRLGKKEMNERTCLEREDHF